MTTYYLLTDELNNDEDNQQFWSNVDGWVDRGSATKFSLIELEKTHYPIDTKAVVEVTGNLIYTLPI